MSRSPPELSTCAGGPRCQAAPPPQVRGTKAAAGHPSRHTAASPTLTRLHHRYTSRTSQSHAMFSSKLTLRAAQHATNITHAAPAQRTAQQCFATATTQRRPHQRRQSSSKASCPPDSTNKPTAAAKAAENSTTQASAAEKTPRRASRMKRTQVEKGSKDKADQFAGLPSVPDTRHVVEKGMAIQASSEEEYTF